MKLNVPRIGRYKKFFVLLIEGGRCRQRIVSIEIHCRRYWYNYSVHITSEGTLFSCFFFFFWTL